jgi:hypothetical protein
MGSGHHMMLKRRPIPEKDLPADGPRAVRQFSYTALTTECRRPLNVLGLGRSGRSVIFGTAAFALRDPEDNPWAEGPAHYVGNATDMADEARTFLVHLLRDSNTVDRVEFRSIFGGDMTDVIPSALAAWEREGTARLEADVLRFVPQDRRTRIRSLLWLVPQEAIEFDLSRFVDLDLSAAGIARLTEKIDRDVGLAGGHRFAGIDGARLLLRTPAGETLRLRLAPGLSDEGPLRLVLETAPNTSDADLRRAVAQLRALLTHHHRKVARRPSAPSNGRTRPS